MTVVPRSASVPNSPPRSGNVHGPVRWPLLREGPQTLSHLTAAERAQTSLELGFQGLLHRKARQPAQDREGAAPRSGRVAADLEGEPGRFLEGPPGFHDAFEAAQTLGLGRAEGAPGERDEGGATRTEEPAEPAHTPEIGHDAEGHLGKADLRARSRHP